MASFPQSADGFVRVALTQTGDKYIYGAEASPSNPNPTAFDCCLAGDTIVHTDRGPVQIVDVRPGDLVASWDDGTLTERKVEAVLEQPVQQLFTLRLRNRSIRATANHPFLVLRRDARSRVGHPVPWRTEWVRLDEIQPGDHLVTLDHYTRQSSESSLTEDLGWLLGAYLGDGTMQGNRVSVCMFGEQADEVERIIRENYATARPTRYDSIGVSVSDAELAELIGHAGFAGATSATKRVPDMIKTAPPNVQRAFLEGYCVADGHVDRRGHVSYSSVSRALLSEVRALCIDLGDQVSNLTVAERRHPITIKGKTVREAQPLWSFSVYPDSSRRDQTILDTYGARRAVPDRSFTVRKVLSIEADEVAPTFDLTIEGTHNFVADGIVVHNSELVEWSLSQIGIRFVDGAENQYNTCKRNGTVISIDQAVSTRGALLFKIGAARGGNSGDHVAISQGDGQTIEARGRAYGVGVWSATSGRSWTHAGMVPGLSGYDIGAGGSAAEQADPQPVPLTPEELEAIRRKQELDTVAAIITSMRTRLALGSTGPAVTILQTGLQRFGFWSPVTGVFDTYTRSLVQQFQARNGKRADGIVGRVTWGRLFPEFVQAAY